jgi:hypothetical protein
MAARPAVVTASLSLVTTRTFAGAAAFGFRFADAVPGAARAKLNRARLNPLVFMTPPRPEPRVRLPGI